MGYTLSQGGDGGPERARRMAGKGERLSTGATQLGLKVKDVLTATAIAQIGDHFFGGGQVGGAFSGWPWAR